ncbi:MAG: hypothetical protein ACYS7M_14785 [Planctomycetota bacterium]|jgi:hypothetical protein
MSKDVRITTEQLREAAGSDLTELMDEVTRAVNEAPGGRVIADSEEAVREAIARFRKKVYERAIQLRAEAAEAAFPPSGPSEE